jgi:DNA/RNA endonuclease YhcR with UshA esterase domain
VSRTSAVGELDRATVTKPIGDCRWRERVRVRGRVRALRVQPWEGGIATLEASLVDTTGGLTVIFMGRRRIAGVRLGAWMEVEGMVLESRGKLAIMNPEYSLLPDPAGTHPS